MLEIACYRIGATGQMYELYHSYAVGKLSSNAGIGGFIFEQQISKI